MKRREFIALLGGAAAASPLAWQLGAHAQQRIPRIGVLTISGPDAMGPFREALRDLGYIEGRTIQMRCDPPRDGSTVFRNSPPDWFGRWSTS